MSRLSNKTALITAAGQGIGRATAIAYAREGARVIATDINEETLATLADTDGIEVHRLDVLDKAAVSGFVKSMESVDVLLNCAGFVANGSILDGSEDEPGSATTHGVIMNITCGCIQQYYYAG